MLCSGFLEIISGKFVDQDKTVTIGSASKVTDSTVCVASISCKSEFNTIVFLHRLGYCQLKSYLRLQESVTVYQTKLGRNNDIIMYLQQ